MARADAGRENYALQFYLDRGLEDHKARGVVGNLLQESSLNTGARNRGDGRDGTDSIGVGQWNGQRARNLARYAQASGQNISALDTQLGFVLHEMGLDDTYKSAGAGFGSERRAGEMLARSRNVGEATAAGISYERPQGWKANNPSGGHGWGNRLSHAQRIGGGVVSAGADQTLMGGAGDDQLAPTKRPSVRDSFRDGNLSVPQSDNLTDSKTGALKWLTDNLPSAEPSPENSIFGNAVRSVPKTVGEAEQGTVGALGARAGQAVRQGLTDFFWTPEKSLPTGSIEAQRETDVLGANLRKMLSGDNMIGVGTGPVGGAGPSGPAGSSTMKMGVPLDLAPAPFMESPYQAPQAPQLQGPAPQPELTMPDYGPILDARNAIGPQQVQPFETPLPPLLSSPTPQSELVAPDYSEARRLFAEAKPEPASLDTYQRQSAWDNLAAGLAAGVEASGWSGIGGALGGMGGGLAKANSRTRDVVLQQQERNDIARRNYALQGSRLESELAEGAADIANKNNTIRWNNSEAARRTDDQNNVNRYEVTTGNGLAKHNAAQANANNQRDFALGGIDLQKDVLEKSTAVNNENAGIRTNNANAAINTANTNTLNEFNVNETNAARSFEVAQRNASRLHENRALNEQLRRPKIASTTKDAIVIQKTDANGEIEFEVKPLRGGAAGYDKDTLANIDAINKTLGDGNPLAQQQKYSLLMGNGNVSGVRHEMAREAVAKGYFDKLVAPGDLEALNEQADAAAEASGQMIGSKEYTEAKQDILTSLVAQQLDLSDPNVLAAASNMGNVGAALLLNAARQPAPGGKPLVPGQGR